MRSPRIAIISLCMVALAAGANVLGAESSQIPARDFAREAQVNSPRLSPGGDYLAVRVDDESGFSHELLIYHLPELKVTSVLRLPKYTVPLDITWVSDDWLVIAKGKAYGSLGNSMYTGELISTDVSGKHQRYL